MQNRILATILFCVSASAISAQTGHYWQEISLRENFEKRILESGERSHLSLMPFSVSDIDSLDAFSTDTSLVLNGMFSEFWKTPADKEFSVGVAPLFIGGVGYSSSRETIYQTAPGLALNFKWGKKWSLYADFIGGEEKLPGYVDTFLDSTQVIPSLGENRADQANPAFVLPTARLAYRPSEYFQFELGYGKNFFGNGYRSHFLSDVPYNNPYLKIETEVWNIKYVNLYSMLSGSEPFTGNPTNFSPKYTTSHYLSWAVTPAFNIGLFETIVWQGSDSLSNRGFDPNYLNPIIFFRPVEYSTGSADNALIGLDLSLKTSRKMMVYGQIVFDEFLLSEFTARDGWWGNKWGAQLGVKWHEPLSFEGFYLQGEINLSRPFTYTHGSVLQNFGHYNQPQAHQLGNNFYEGLLRGYYEKGDFYGEAQFVYAVYGRDTDSLNLGGDIYRSYVNPAEIYGNSIAQGLQTQVYFQSLTAGIILNRDLNLRAGLTYTLRREENEVFGVNTEHIIGLSVATRIFNSNRVF
ncbi:MAG: hypothetical protein ABR574_08460 [Cryomorphaceae bacterium]|nr:hypothetical protein [Flavobacteriales bacterium]